jgi:putative GTP pyrophosphokinase
VATLPVSATSKQKRIAQRLVGHYAANRHLYEVMLTQLASAIHGSQELMQHVHSTRSRVKDETHLRDKLIRKMQLATTRHRNFTITEKNLFSRITDLAGFRILHLHMRQMEEIDLALRGVLTEYRYAIIEGPTARTWDDESREYFASIGIRQIKSPKMYTSVHYIVRPNKETPGRCEIQVRTLAEELWGEVDHSMNYPHESKYPTCREQIKVLARVTSSCSRLVDSIYFAATNPK